MEEVVQPEAEAPLEFEGVGSSIDAAVLDAVRIATGQDEARTNVETVVVAWGAKVTGIGGARLFWARVRKGTRG